MSLMVEDEVRRAYEEGGPQRLSEHLHRLDSYLPGKHILLNSRGRDLVTGEDHSELLQPPVPGTGPPRMDDGRMIMMGPSRGSPYRFITLVRPWWQPPSIFPYLGAVVLVIAGMATILALHLAAPLRKLRQVVERFGKGELAARSGSARQDEIGELARAFDEMADRIETLLAAERRLLQDVSHELRSPLARLSFAVELAREDEERDEALARVRKEAERMTSLVGELLQLTRIEGDPSAGTRGRVGLHLLVQEIVATCNLEAATRGCHLRIQELEPATLTGEQELLHRAVENVVRNAIRHSPEGAAVDIALSLSGGLATVSVRDHGPGVPQQHLAAIFKPFFRVENDRSRASGGVGLGLAIARRAVEVHQGKIEARNAGPGLAITITLPCAACCAAVHGRHPRRARVSRRAVRLIALAVRSGVFAASPFRDLSRTTGGPGRKFRAAHD